MSVTATIIIRKVVDDNDKAIDFYLELVTCLYSDEHQPVKLEGAADPFTMTMSITQKYPSQEIPS